MRDATQCRSDFDLTRAVRQPRWLHGVILLIAFVVASCSLDGVLNSNQLPKGVSDPALMRTPDGARYAYNGTLVEFGGRFGGIDIHAGLPFVVVTGALSDELQNKNDEVDRRTTNAGGWGASLYLGLQKVRGQASQAIGLLTRYLPDQPALAGHMYALQGYAEIFLAELYCSGIPLSTLDFDGDFTYRPGSTTEQVFVHAVALMDTALTLAKDNVRIVQLARVGKARALLATGAFSEAAAAVAEVPDDYRYDVQYTSDSIVDANGNVVRSKNFASIDRSVGSLGGISYRWLNAVTVPDREGGNGMDWRTSDDPRTVIAAITNRPSGSFAFYHPSKYDTLGTIPIVLASGVEARLIEAEVALKTGDVSTWLVKLNHLRQTMWTSIRPAINTPLSHLDDPGTGTARVNLLFRERAFWLFLTGHRQGDLRRLIRQYGRDQGDVYPVGPYFEGGVYGADVTVPIPSSEFANPLYTGCASRGA